MLKQVVDAFTYNAALQLLPCRYFPQALGQMDILRRAVNHRARWYVVPDDQGEPVNPFDTFFYQIAAADGAYLWGYNFHTISATSPDQTPVATQSSDLLVQVVDSCTGVPLFQDYCIGSAAQVNSQGTADYGSRMSPVLLTQPRLILDPALVNVYISNRTANTIYCQLLLMFTEPCLLVEEKAKCPDLC